jgi:hypothetical protein
VQSGGCQNTHIPYGLHGRHFFHRTLGISLRTEISKLNFNGSEKMHEGYSCIPRLASSPKITGLACDSLDSVYDLWLGP